MVVHVVLGAEGRTVRCRRVEVSQKKVSRRLGNFACYSLAQQHTDLESHLKTQNMILKATVTPVECRLFRRPNESGRL